MALVYPDIDPVAVSLGPVVIRWYALAYVAGLFLGWAYIRALVKRPPHALTPPQVDDFLVWATLGVVLGGRLGYVFFYKLGHFLTHPWEIVFLWQGGMSFHGGLLGMILVLWLFSRRHQRPFLGVTDVVAVAVPVGLFFGRIANFINGELFGRVTDSDWGMVFPTGGPLPRHPSQLYEAALEGLALGGVLFALWLCPRVRRQGGMLSGAFVAGYGVFRSIAEMYREPDLHLGFLAGGLTMGQLLSLPMIVGGVGIMVWASCRPPLPDRPAADEENADSPEKPAT